MQPRRGNFREVCLKLHHDRIYDFGFSFFIKDYIDDVATAANRGVMLVPGSNYAKLQDFFELADIFIEDQDSRQC